MKRSDKVEHNKHENIFEFWNLKQPTEPDNTCHVYFDREAFFKQGQNVIDRIEAEKRYKEDGLKPSTLQGLGAERALQRERRLEDLKSGIKSGRFKTVEQAVLGLDGIRTANSVITYLKELGLKLKYEKTGEIVGSDEPIVNKRNEAVRGKQIVNKYYDGDPLKGGKEITEKQFQKLKEKALSELKEQLAKENK